MIVFFDEMDSIFRPAGTTCRSTYAEAAQDIFSKYVADPVEDRVDVLGELLAPFLPAAAS